MADTKQRIAAENFAKDWAGKGYEKGDTHTFWLALLSKVFGIAEPDKYIVFEKRIRNENTNFIDCYIPATHVLIEQKSIWIDLTKPELQSDKTCKTPYQQAKSYADTLGYDERARWIIVCNFTEFHIYDMSKSGKIDPEILYLKDFAKEYHRLQFLVNENANNLSKEMEVSFQAGELVGKLYDAFLKEYKNPNNPESLKSLNKLCVRLVFCMYAEDAGIFVGQDQFHDYLKRFEARDARRALIDLFKVLDQKPEIRDPYLDKSLADFPYVNGGLFSDEDIEIPQFTEKIMDLLLNKASLGFDWSEISPTIFGALFESTLNQETRRTHGMHYTSIENIHKVIDPLFLDSLKEEFEMIKGVGAAYQPDRLKAFQKKLASLKFLDPACGSGNFLTETYLSLRKLENEVLKLRFKGQMVFDVEGIIQVSIGQFYGIELNDFAVTVAKTALWIAESQMMKDTEKIVACDLHFLPLKSYANIVEGNALRVNWDGVVPKGELSYIIGNPPFYGGMWMSPEQKADMKSVLGDVVGFGELDYVSGWYRKSAEYIQRTKIEVAFVSTNSIVQGEQATILWENLIEQYGVQINFAYRTFKWENEAKGCAAVHCVIVGFSLDNPNKLRILFDEKGNKKTGGEINQYLVNAPRCFIHMHNRPLCNVPIMRFGSMPRDGSNFMLSEEEKDYFISKNPISEKYIRQFMMGREFLHNKNRYCLWLLNANPSELKQSELIMDRIEKVKNFRLSSKASSTRKFANTPTLFCQIAQPDTNYIAVPKVSSENREYVPIGFLPPEIIAGDKLFVIPDADLYHFGVLTSNIHMSWMRTVCGRLKSDYSYSNTIVYNNFPWPNPTEDQKAAIEREAQSVLAARALYPESSLADLYDPLTMPVELRKAHERLDKAVEKAYGRKFENEAEIVSYLMEEYQKLIKNK